MIHADLFNQLRRHSALLTNAGGLTAGMISASALGFLYWALAARGMSNEAVGYAAATISLISLLGQIGELGLGTLLIGEIGAEAAIVARLTVTSLYIVAGSTALLAISFLTIAALYGFNLGAVTRTGSGDAIFLCTATLTGVLLVVDQSLVARLEASTQMMRNVCFAVCKLLLLAGVIALSNAPNETALLLTWALGQTLSVVFLLFLKRRAQLTNLRPSFAVARVFAGGMLRHHVLNIVIQVPGLALPFIVTVLLSAGVNAGFYAAWMLANVVTLIPASLATVVYSIGSRDKVELSAKLRLSLGISFGFCGISALILLIFSNSILAFFNPTYPEIAGTVLKILGFSSLLLTIKYHCIAIQRLNRRFVHATTLLACGGVLELANAIIGAHAGGLVGLTSGWLAALLIEAAFMSITVFATARAGLSSGSLNVDQKIGLAL